jgi:hypothetical protein
LSVPSEFPPALLAVTLLYHWYVKLVPVAVTVIGLKAPFEHWVCVAVDWLTMEQPGSGGKNAAQVFPEPDAGLFAKKLVTATFALTISAETTSARIDKIFIFIITPFLN